jgi:hypothetical protein
MALEDCPIPNDQTLGGDIAEYNAWRLDVDFFFGLDISRDLPKD